MLTFKQDISGAVIQNDRNIMSSLRETIRLPEFHDAAAEYAFWKHHDTQMYAPRVFFLILSLVIYAALVFLDLHVGGEAAVAMLHVRVVGCALFLIGLLTFTMPHRTPDQRERSLEVCAFASSGSQILLIAFAPPEASEHYQFAFGVIMSVGTLMLVPRFSTVITVIGVVMTAYIVTIPWHTGDVIAATVNTLFNMLIAFAVVMGSFQRERFARRQASMSAQLAVVNDELIQSRHEALVARDEAVAANKAKNHFLASVSHELRTPMNAILGFSGMMRSEVFGPVNTPRYAEYIEHIHFSGLLLQTNIDDLLDLARLEAGKIGWIDEVFRIDSSLDSVMATCEDAAQKAGVSMSLSNDMPGAHINADPTRIAQAVINLVTNALKFSDKGSTVHIKARRNETGECLIHIIDTGCGMSPENIEQVRKPFAQAHEDSYSKAKGGLGLGLSIVSGIVTTMDGRLDLESEVDVGTTATLVIPAHRVTDPVSKAA